MTSQECIQRKTDTDTEIALGFILTELRKGKWRIIIVEKTKTMTDTPAKSVAKDL